MNKTAIKNFAVWARQKLIDDIKYKAGMLGITENGIAEKLPQSTNDLQFFDIGTKNYAEVSGKEISQRNALIYAIKHKETEGNKFKEAFKYVVEEVAYTWFNRLIAIRFMEVNDYLPSGIRVLSSENKAKNEPDFVTSPFDTDLEFTPYEQDRVVQLKDENKLDELFRMLFIKQCNKLHDILPELFERTDDYTELLLTMSFTDKDGVIYHLTHDIPESNFNVEQEGQVEIIGWLYQYYNSELKDETFAQLKKNVKITKERIPAATQLFTPDWIVRYMVENSLGRLWIEGHPNNSLKNEWKYYLDEAEQEESVIDELEKIRDQYGKMNLEEIKVIDPCMGSGHILVYAFDVLMQIYESCGYTQRDAAKSIITNNIFGLDIDKRAYQLSYFALMMKARQYSRRIFNEDVKPNVFVIEDNTVLTSDAIDYISNGNQIIKADLKSISDDLYNAKEYGSIIEVTPVDFNAIYRRIDEMKQGELDIFSAYIPEQVTPIIRQAEVMAQKYDVVVTNPPYMGNKGFSTKLLDYITNWYYECKIDLFAVFIQKCSSMVNKNGIYSLITPDSWMFLSRFEKLRVPYLSTNTFCTIAHMGFGAFDSGFGTVAFTAIRKDIPMYKSTCLRLVDMLTSSEKEEAYFTSPRIISNKMNYSKVIGNPICYWASQRQIDSFKHKTIKDLGSSCVGLVTGNNEKFIRGWYEINYSLFGRNMSREEAISSESLKWFPINQSGDYRKWYGNNVNVFDWWHNGFNIKKFKLDRYLRGEAEKKNSKCWNEESYFHEGLTWSRISTDRFSARYSQLGCTAGTTCPIYFPNVDKEYILGLLNTKVIGTIVAFLNPTVSFQAADIDRIPVIVDQGFLQRVKEIVAQNIYESKKDWDSFETSWDFTEHPLVRLSKDLWDATAVGATMSYYYGGHPKVGSPLELCYMLWQGECNERFNKLKANEEELNRIFIDIYGLGDELTPDVEDKDVTVRKADLQRDIKSLISYAVGCMFGRYSLDTEGIAYAGGDWNTGKYERFIPDADNCIPITDEEYFEDDIVGLFCAWLKKVYGEDSLEQNLDYIAKALGNKGATSREVIRNYFLNDFIKDHIKTYQKRPIYWLFDSGKQNGFKALCYMHRWNADTTGNMRVEYLHRMQRVYEKEINRMQEIIDNSRDNKEISNATKRKEKLQKQIKETKDYDAKVAHLALSRIDIDLDDGVKVNYEKVQTASDGKKMQILAKI
ncbi:BREX-1 system adenine-specific DNA-methyltransferase PglX [Hornefia butyriciproducens]|uniref:BREX-1 system adenine-specific DNA-methyltransferase PglX n=1 Tax=Hornefia butyriciproducens TaxID=2652293 RepID=UPI003D07B40A